MLSVALAGIGALAYGAADFLGGLAATRLRPIVVTAAAAASGFTVLMLIYPIVGGSWTAPAVMSGMVSGVLGVVALALLYACLAIGPMSILSPLTALATAFPPIVWGLLVNAESLSEFGYLGLVIAMIAVVLVGFAPAADAVRPTIPGLFMAIGAGLAIGAFLIVMDQTDDQSGVVPLIVSRGASTVLTLVVVASLALWAARAGGPGLRSPMGVRESYEASGSDATVREYPEPHQTAGTLRTVRQSAWTLVFVCGAVDALGNALTLIALRAGELSVVSALTALYPAGTIILAAIVLRERVAAVQWAGLVLALVAGVLLGLG